MLVVRANLLSDAGATRASNEDSGAVVIPDQPAVLASKGVLIVVADGMGGHEGGGTASAVAVTTVSNAYYGHEGSPGEALAAAVQQANQAILERASRQPELKGMGTTCTALALADGFACVAHVGDSRAYLIRSGACYRMTADHSGVMQMVREGMLTAAEAKNHSGRNVILRALGTQHSVEIDTWPEPMPLRPGDRWLVCSDGLHDVITDDEIARIVSSAPPDQACQTLIRMARERHCGDNVTAGVAEVAEETEPRRQAVAKETREVSV